MSALWLGSGLPIAAEEAGATDFIRDIRPILSNHCFQCHGPDQVALEAGLRLDQRSHAVAETESGAIAIVPGNPEASELVARIESPDEDLRMPPASTLKPLSAAQRELLKRWIAEGAPYADHWAFVAPVRPPPPTVTDVDWPRNEIDRFVLRRLEQAGLVPSAEVDRAGWLRRVTLDLTGLPPTPDELDTFLADRSDAACEAVVDRLLHSPRHAERMTMHWLDAARYADTNGYNNDETRTMWPWREWVIDAFAEGMPYDRFLTEQLAGDLLPGATLQQRLATAFNRNHVLTTEGGIIAEEYDAEYVADRVHTMGTVFMGLSLRCARCHDHKYDPISQREYYEFAALFANIKSNLVRYKKLRMAEPLLKVPSRQQQAELDELEEREADIAARLETLAGQVDEDLPRWEESLTPEQKSAIGREDLVAHFPLDEPDGDAVVDLVDATRRGTIHGRVARGPGRLGGSLEFDGDTYVAAGQVGAFEGDEKISLAAWIRPTSISPTTVLSKMDDANAYRGYDLILEEGKVCAHFIHRWPELGFHVKTLDPVSLGEWQHVVATYDGSRRGSGVTIYVDGEEQLCEITTDNPLEGTLQTDKPFHIGSRQNSLSFEGRIDDVRIYAAELTADQVRRLAAAQLPSAVGDLLAVPRAERSAAQQEHLRQYYLRNIDSRGKQLEAERAGIEQRRAEIQDAMPEVMVMRELAPPRPTYFLHRGQYDRRGEQVEPGVPAALCADPPGAVMNRLDLTRWLSDPAHPLTARVAVNRWWGMLFGTGLVETAEDFGVQGTMPSHPQLLDWLATELIRRRWDQREMLRLMVLSATYRQSSQATPELLARDPDNRLLARAPRYRLPAETVRDNALAISGLLQDRIGGPSVKPYQPAGLWEDVSVERGEKYVADTDEGLYRRSMYTFWKRTCPPPAMSAFDAPDRETCVVRRGRTNTPLQALVLLNDPTYVEAARKFAERVMRGAVDEEPRLELAYKLALSRPPRPSENAVLREIHGAAWQRYGGDPEAAEKLLAVGQSPRDNALDPAELAAWTTVTSILLNLDETITRQ